MIETSYSSFQFMKLLLSLSMKIYEILKNEKILNAEKAWKGGPPDDE